MRLAATKECLVVLGPSSNQSYGATERVVRCWCQKFHSTFQGNWLIASMSKVGICTCYDRTQLRMFTIELRTISLMVLADYISFMHGDETKCDS